MRRVVAVIGWFILIVVLLFFLDAFMHYQPDNGYAPRVKQKAQLHSIDAALELFGSQFNGYPPSDANDVNGLPYCGAMKLAEAVMGRDAMGFHPKSTFRADGLDPNGAAPLYVTSTAKDRPGPFLPPESANLHRLLDIYGKGKTGSLPENAFVLCDTYRRKPPFDRSIGMPILYYRARSSGTKHDASDPDNPENIYDYRDNLAILNLGIPGDPNAVHPLADPKRFYLNTQNDKVQDTSRPYRADSYILISAGYDGLYGTAGDILNFDWRYRE